MNKQNKKSVLEKLLDQITPVQQALIDDRMIISANIDDLLKQRGLSKKIFAERLGKDPSVITRWLSGTHNFTTETLSEIRVILGVTLMELVRECKPPLVLLPDNRMVQQGSTFNADFLRGSALFNLADNKKRVRCVTIEVNTNIHGFLVNTSSIKPVRKRSNNGLRKRKTNE